MEAEEMKEEQMTPLFVCETTIDVTTQEEASKAAAGKSNFVLNLFLYGMCFAMAAYMIYDSIRFNRWQQNALMLVVIALVIVYSIYSRNNAPKKALRRWEEAILRKYGSNALHLTTEFYELSLAQTLREDEEQFVGDGYSTILELKETEHLFLLRHGKNQYYFISKTGFTKGTAEEFKSFISARIGG